MRSALLTAALLSLAAGGTFGQTAPRPVDEMSCDELWSETMSAGMLMSSQLDPSFAAEAQAMRDKINDPARRAKATSEMAALSAACAAGPVAMPACAAMQHSYTARMGAEAKQNQAEMAALHDKLQASTAGIDMARMQAVQARLDKLKCPQPRGLAE